MEKYRKTLTRNVIRAALLCIFIMVLYVLVELIETSALAGFLPNHWTAPKKRRLHFFASA